MGRRILLMFTFLTIAILSACGANVGSNDSETELKNEQNQADQLKDDKEKDKNSFIKLEDEEFKDIIKSNLADISTSMEEFSPKHTMDIDEELVDSWFDGWTEDDLPEQFDGNEKAFKDLKEQDSLMELMTEEGLQELIIDNLQDYLFEYHPFVLPSTHTIEHGIRFQVIKQKENSFNASVLRLYDDNEPSGPDTVMFEYIKDENDHWKLDGFQSIPPEESPFELTLEDFEEHDPNNELVETREKSGEEYLVIQNKKEKGSHFVYNVNDSRPYGEYQFEVDEEEREIGEDVEEQGQYDNSEDDIDEESEMAVNEDDEGESLTQKDEFLQRIAELEEEQEAKEYDGESTLEIRNQILADVELWDDLLNSAYNIIQDNHPDAEEIKEEQRQWLEEVEKESDDIFASEEELGTMMRLESDQYKLEETRKRTKELVNKYMD